MKCLEVVFIVVKVNGYLKNKTNNECTLFNEKAIKNKNKITYHSDNTKYVIKIYDNKIIMIREGNDFVNSFVFEKDRGICNYLLKENDYSFDIDINIKEVEIGESSMYILYEIVDSGYEYEFKMEMSDIL